MKKKQGFKGQRSIVIPEFITNEVKLEPLGRHLYITDIGFYPNALFHQRTRHEGSKQYILIYCISGEGWISLQGKKSKVHSNQYFIIPKETAHSYGSDEKNPWSIYWIHFDGLQASHFNNPFEEARTISPSKIARTEERLQLFEEIMRNLEMGYSKENLQYANICLLHFLASFKYINQFRQIKKIKGKDPVENAILYMRENLSKKLILEEIAKESELSVSHFSLLFKNKTGRSPMDYLIHLRIQRACQLLDHTTLKVLTIAHEIGIEDQYYFSRLFKKIMGISPVAYRKMPKG